MKYLSLILSAFIIASCHSGNESSSDSDLNKQSQNDSKKEIEETKTDIKNYPSEEWQIAKYTDGDMGFMTPDEEVKLRAIIHF